MARTKRGTVKLIAQAVAGFVIPLVSLPDLFACGLITFHARDYQEGTFLVESEKRVRISRKGTGHKMYEGVLNNSRERISLRSAGATLHVGDSVPVRYSVHATSAIFNGYTVRVISPELFSRSTPARFFTMAAALVASSVTGSYLLGRIASKRST